jgi:hypothetical protein
MSRLFSRVVPTGGEYVLAVDLSELQAPHSTFSYSYTAKLVAGWTLKRADTKTPVWEATIRTEHTATAVEALVGSTRARLATDGAARENIAQGLARISKLDL